MGRNLGKYMGLGIETNYGQAVAASRFLLLDGMPSPSLDAPLKAVPNPSGFGDIITYPGQRQARISGNALVTPAEIGDLLAGLLGLPSTSGTGPYTHVFTPQANVPSYTVEFLAGAGFSRFPGAKFSSLAFSHSPEGALTVGIEGLAKDRLTDGTAQTPSYPTDLFLASALQVQLGGTDISCEIENVTVNIGFSKKGDPCFGSETVGGVDIENGGEVTVELTYRVEASPGVNPVTALGQYKAGSVSDLLLKWVRDANAELDIHLPNAVFATDPMVVTNDALGWARVNLQFRASGAGANFFTATLINSVSSYAP